MRGGGGTQIDCHARRWPPRSPIHRAAHHTVGVRSFPTRHDTHTGLDARRLPPRSPTHRATHHTVGVRSRARLHHGSRRRQLAPCAFPVQGGVPAEEHQPEGGPHRLAHGAFPDQGGVPAEEHQREPYKSCHARQSPPRSPIHDTHVARGEITTALANPPRHSPLRRRPITSSLASSPRRPHGPPNMPVATEFNPPHHSPHHRRLITTALASSPRHSQAPARGDKRCSRTAHFRPGRLLGCRATTGEGDKSDSGTVHSQIRGSARLQSTSERGDRSDPRTAHSQIRLAMTPTRPATLAGRHRVRQPATSLSTPSAFDHHRARQLTTPLTSTSEGTVRHWSKGMVRVSAHFLTHYIILAVGGRAGAGPHAILIRG